MVTTSLSVSDMVGYHMLGGGGGGCYEKRAPESPGFVYQTCHEEINNVILFKPTARTL